MSEEFDAGWLRLREAWDATSRNAGLADRFSAALPARPRLLDLGAGTGSLFRWLAPRIGRAQAWTLVDADEGLLAEALQRIAAWAMARGYTITSPGRALLVHTPQGAWRVEALVQDLAEGVDTLPLEQVDAVVNSALCDLASAPWLDDLVACCAVEGLPCYAALCVDGKERFLPPYPGDQAVARAFRRDQRRDKGLWGPALGAGAPAFLRRCFTEYGFRVFSAPSPWEIPGAAWRMAQALAEGHLEAAVRQGVPAKAWRSARHRQVKQGRLGVRIGHVDLLALPPQ